jgi:hypothetical protein
MKPLEALHPEAKRIADLVMKVCFDTITPEEQSELDLWVAQSEGNRETLEEMINLCSTEYTDELEKRKQSSVEKIMRKINQTEG